MKIVDLAAQINILDAITPTTIAAIAFWIRAQVPTINSMLYENYVVDPNSNYEVISTECGQSAEISADAMAIIRQFYKIYDINQQIKNLLISLNGDLVLSYKDEVGGTSVTRVNRNEIMKTLNTMKKDEMQILKDMVTAYRIHKAVPSQVAGNDTDHGWWNSVSQFYPYPSVSQFYGR